MTYNATTPNAGQSPFLFPPAANVNFNRLKTIIAGDHIFNDTAAANDGTHKQVTLTNRTAPVALPTDTNCILYSNVDTFGGSQLWFFNGIDTAYQLTNPINIDPIRIGGSMSLGTNVTTVIYNPGFNWGGTGTVYAIKAGSMAYSFNTMAVIAGVANEERVFEKSGTPTTPTFDFSGTSLRVRNNDSSTLTIYWSVVVNRIINN